VTQRHVIRTLIVTVVAEVISFGVLIPLVPLLLTEPSSQFFILPAGMSIDTGYILLGLLIGIYPVGHFIATPILGELSDIYGRKLVVQLSVAGTVIASLIFAYGILIASLPVLFLSRLVNGLTGGLISVSQAAIADVSETDEKSANFGLIGAAFGIGFLFGPFLGGLLSSDLHPLLGPTTPFIFAAAVSGISLVYVTARLEETSPMEDKAINWSKPVSQLRKGLSMPDLGRVFGANFFYFAGFAFFTTFIPVFLVKQFGFAQFEIGNFFLYIGLLTIIGQTVIVPKLYARFEEARIVPLTLFMTGLAVLVMPLPASLLVFLLIVPVFSFSNALTQVGLNTVVSNRASARDQGLALGTNQSLRALGNAIPSMLSGVAAAVATASAPLVIAGIIMMLTAVVFYRIETSAG